MANRNALLSQMLKLVKTYQKKIVPRLRAEIKDLKENLVEVIRCKDCKHIEGTQYGGYCCFLECGVSYEGYCSYGKRRTDDG